jgi:hypothetical protein
VSTRCNEGRQRTLATWLRARAGRATPGSRRHPFGSSSSVSRVGGARLRRRALIAGILSGAATGGSRAASNGDGMPQHTAVDAMTQGADEHAPILVTRGADRWPTRRW